LSENLNVHMVDPGSIPADTHESLLPSGMTCGWSCHNASEKAHLIGHVRTLERGSALC